MNAIGVKADKKGRGFRWILIAALAFGVWLGVILVSNRQYYHLLSLLEHQKGDDAALINDPNYSVPLLVRALSFHDPFWRTAARSIHHWVSERIYGLQPSRSSQAEVVRANAAKALGFFWSKGQAAVPGLLHALNDPAFQVQYNAAEALKAIRPTNQTAAAQLASRLLQARSSGDIRARCADALGELPYLSEEAISALISAYSDPRSDKWLRVSCATGLGKYATAAARAVPALTNGMADSDAIVRTFTIEALVRIGVAKKEVREVVLAALRDQSYTVRNKAAWWVGEAGTNGTFALPDLKELAQFDPHPQVREAAEHSVQALEKVLH